MREDLRQFADALGLGRFVLGGHSMGGTVATLFAERYPGRLAGLILVDTPPPDGSASYDPGPRPDGDLPYDWAVMPAIFEQLNHPDPAWWAELPTIATPALVIGGGSTSPAPQYLLARLADLVPNAELVTIEGAGHAVHRPHRSVHVGTDPPPLPATPWRSHPRDCPDAPSCTFTCRLSGTGRRRSGTAPGCGCARGGRPGW